MTYRKAVGMSREETPVMALEAWTPRDFSENERYLRVKMHEKVTLYIFKYASKNGKKRTEVYFYGPNHKKRAAAYAAITGGHVYRGNPSHAKETATTVEVWRDK
jgi:hypothetical protein